MIVSKVSLGDNLCRIYNDIPAYMENGVLVIGHNGSSRDHGQFRALDLVNYKAEDFEFFANHTYRGASSPSPHFLYKGVIPYELMKVFSGNYGSRKLMYTFLSPCREETYFCKCKDCGENFVIDCYEVPFYRSKGLIVPTVRCKSCISKRKSAKKN